MCYFFSSTEGPLNRLKAVKNSTEKDTKPPKNTSITKFMGLFLIISSLLMFSLWFIYYFYPAIDEQHYEVKKTTTSNKQSGLQVLWEDDIIQMFEEKVFHSGVSSIRKVRVFMLDQNLHSQLQYLKAPFKQRKDGQNLLEVSFMSHHSDIENSEKIIVQYNLTDKDSGEMFWEHSRTINIPNEILSN